MSNYKIIDIEKWNRKDHFHFFKDFDDPFFNVTANVDVTQLLKKSRQEKFSFFLASVHCAQVAIQQIESFRYRIIDDQVICYHDVHPGTTALGKDKVFKYAYLTHNSDRQDFIAQAAKDIREQLAHPALVPSNGVDRVYYSTMPWVSFTSFKHARNATEGDSIPRIVFGKYFEENGKQKMPVSVEVNHALVDGYHVGQYFETFQGLLDL